MSISGWRYSRFLRNWLLIVTTVVGGFILATPAQAQQSSAVTTAWLNMRTGPGTNYSIIMAIPEGANVGVSGCSGGWCEVSYSGRNGWSSASYLRFQAASGAPQPPQPAPQPPQAGGQVQATTAVSLNMRRGPNTSYAVIRAIPASATVSVYRCIENYTWCEVGYAGSTGWASARYLQSPQYGQRIPSVGEQLGLAIINFILGQFGGGQQPPQPPQQREPGPNEVCFYRDFDYQGASTCATNGQFDRSLGGGWNDAISSIRTGSNASVEVCRDVNYGQPCRVVSGNISRLPGGWNDMISSFRTANFGGGQPPATGEACFFENWNYSGPSICFSAGENSTFLGNWNDRISSIRLDQGVTAIVCSDANYGGECVQYSSSVSQLTGSRNDTASSLQVR